MLKFGVCVCVFIRVLCRVYTGSLRNIDECIFWGCLRGDASNTERKLGRTYRLKQFMFCKHLQFVGSSFSSQEHG